MSGKHAVKSTKPEQLPLIPHGLNTGIGELTTSLFESVRNETWILRYQPVVDTITRRITGAEAMMGWHHECEGWIEGDALAAIAGQAGLATILDRNVLNRSCIEAAQWNLPTNFSLRVNISSNYIAARSFPSDVRKALLTSGLPATNMRIEIAEAPMKTNTATTLRNLEAIRELGVGVDVDGFGTGYGSALYLKHFPVTGIKLDRRFVAGIGRTRRDNVIIDGLAGLATDLGLTVVADGVTSELQRQSLAESGICEAQGWLFAPAVDTNEFADMLIGGAL